MYTRVEGRVRMLACGPGRAVKRKANIGGADGASREWIRVQLLVVFFMALAAPACGPASPWRPDEEMVPFDLVPAGFKPEECWFEKGREENLFFRGSFGLPGGNGGPPSPTLHIFERRIRCLHVPKGRPSRIVEGQNKSLPRQAHCGGPDGLIRRCDDGEEG